MTEQHVLIKDDSELVETIQRRAQQRRQMGIPEATEAFNLREATKEWHEMGDLQQYIEKRKASDLEFAQDFDEGYAAFKIGVYLRPAREAAGLTQEEVARQLNTAEQRSQELKTKPKRFDYPC